MLQCPTDNLIITIDKKHQDRTASGIYLDTTHTPEDHVTITGKVVSIPRMISNRVDMKGYTTKGVQPGDTVIFRYDVVFHYNKQVENESSFGYKYELFYKGQSYWRCSIIKTFAYIHDNQINMINGYVMLEPPHEMPTNLYMPHRMVAVPRTAAAVVSYIGRPLTHLKPIDVQAGDTVYFDAKIAQHYQINGKPFIILKQSHILGKKVDNNIIQAV